MNKVIDICTVSNKFSKINPCHTDKLKFKSLPPAFLPVYKRKT